MNNILTIIADNPALFEAVKKAVLGEFDVSTISLLKLGGLDDKRLGELVRAQIEGVRAVEEAFRKIGNYKSRSGQPERVNPAR